MCAGTCRDQESWILGSGAAHGDKSLSVGVGNQTLVPLEGQCTFLTTQPSLQSLGKYSKELKWNMKIVIPELYTPKY